MDIQAMEQEERIEHLAGQIMALSRNMLLVHMRFLDIEPQPCLSLTFLSYVIF